MAQTQSPSGIVTIGFGGNSFTNACPVSVTLQHGADIEHIKCNNEFKTSLISNKSHTIKFEGVILATSPTAVAGDVVTINSIAYLLTGVTYSYSESAARITLDGIKHADATYS